MICLYSIHHLFLEKLCILSICIFYKTVYDKYVLEILFSLTISLAKRGFKP